MGNIESSATQTPNWCVYYNKNIPPQSDFQYCPYCGSKLVNQLHSEIEYKDLEFSKKDLIGQGTYAKVYKGRIRGVNVAVKVPNLDKLVKSEKKKRTKSDESSSWDVQAGMGSEGDRREKSPENRMQFDVEGEDHSSSSSASDEADDSDDTPALSQKDLAHAYSDRFQNFLSEVKHLREVNHPNVCLLMGTCFVQEEGQRKLLLVYELMDEDINSYILRTKREKTVPSLIQRLLICCQVASGLSWVASKGIIHGDIKPTNVLKKDNVFKVTDFGLSVFESTSDAFEGGAPIWSAPEILERSTYPVTLAVDVFSFGYLLWHILGWHDEDSLFPHVNNTQSLIETVCKRQDVPDMTGIPERVQELIRWCLSYRPEDRPTYAQLIVALNDTIFDVALPNDRFAREFWRHYFSSKSGTLEYSVSVSAFMEKFSRFLGLRSTDENKLETVREFFALDGVVTFEQFARIVALFGPLAVDEDPSGRKSPLARISKRKFNAVHVVDTMEQLRAEPWFCGMVPTKKVEDTLRDEEPGAYLVRYSNNPKVLGNFCLSRVSKDRRIRHHYITKSVTESGMRVYSLQVSKDASMEAPSISDLLNIPTVKSVFMLQRPISKLASFRRPEGKGKNVVGAGYQLFGFKASDEDMDLVSMAASPPSIQEDSASKL